MNKLKILLLHIARSVYQKLPASMRIVLKDLVKKESVVIHNYNQSGIAAINKKILDKKIEQLREQGTRKTKRSTLLIVSLTSFPQRMYDVQYALYSLLTQSLKPDKVILWLSREEFPNGLNDVPAQVKRLTKFGLEIDWVKDNIKAYKKLIPAMNTYPDAVIVTADDDIFYPKSWLKNLYNAYLKNKDSHIYAYRAKQILYSDCVIAKYSQWPIATEQGSSMLFFPTGAGGVLFPPGVLHQNFSKQNEFITLAPLADDIWYWAMAVLNRKQVQIVPGYKGLVYINPERELRQSDEYTLSRENVVGEKNDLQLENVFRKYPILKIISEEFNSDQYWENRYKIGGSSGAGSYGRLAEFKAKIINDFIAEKKISSVIEFGVGDGNQLSLLKVQQYIGFDVSNTILEKIKVIFAEDKNKKFYHIDDFNNQRADLTLSLDVLYHLLNDTIFENYMRNLFKASKKYVIIYSSNKDEYHCQHVVHRKFTDWIVNNQPSWVLASYIKNQYPSDPADPSNTSFADFYIYGRTLN